MGSVYVLSRDLSLFKFKVSLMLEGIRDARYFIIFFVLNQSICVQLFQDKLSDLVLLMFKCFFIKIYVFNMKITLQQYCCNTFFQNFEIILNIIAKKLIHFFVHNPYKHFLKKISFTQQRPQQNSQRQSADIILPVSSRSLSHQTRAKTETYTKTTALNEINQPCDRSAKTRGNALGSANPRPRNAPPRGQTLRRHTRGSLRYLSSRIPGPLTFLHHCMDGRGMRACVSHRLA